MNRRPKKNKPGRLTAAASSGGFTPWWSRPWVVGLFLAAATFAVYWPVMGCDFINTDDPDYFSSNPHVLGGLTRKGVVWAFSTNHTGYWQPLIWLSYMLDVSLFGTGAAGPHFTNLLLHAANTLLLFAVLRRFTGAFWRSALVAALFAWHPLRVESVAWVTERKDVLSAFFGFLSLLFYGRYVQQFKIQNSKFKMFYGLSLFFFACGLMSKSMLVTLPLVMLLLDWWPLGRWELIQNSKFKIQNEEEATRPSTINSQLSTPQQLLLEKLPFVLLSLIFGAVTIRAQNAVGAMPELGALPLGVRMENVVVSYARYLAKMVCPMNLALPYPYVGHWPASQVICSVIAIGGVTLAAIRLWRRPYMLFGWFWFLGMLFPVAGLLQSGSQSMADRFTYLPSIGLFVMLVWGAGDLWSRSALPRWPAPMAALLVLAACAWASRGQLGYWRNSEILFRHAVAVTQANTFAYKNLGYYLASEGKEQEAVEVFRAGLNASPDATDLMGGLAYVLGNQLTNYVEAEALYQAALRASPEDWEPHYNFAIFLGRVGRTNEMIEQYQAALRLKPDYADARNNLGILLASQQKLDEAVAQFREALRLNPGAANFHCNLGNALAAQDKYAAAVAEYEEALRLKPDYAYAENNLGGALEMLGRNTEALRHYQLSVQLDAHYAAGRFNLGCLLAKLGRRGEAIVQLQQAVRLQPDHAEARQKLRELGVAVPQ